MLLGNQPPRRVMVFIQQITAAQSRSTVVSPPTSAGIPAKNVHLC